MTRRTQEEVYGYDRFKLLVLLLLLAGLVLVAFYGERLGLTSDETIAAEPTAGLEGVAPTLAALPTESAPVPTAEPTIAPTAAVEPTATEAAVAASLLSPPAGSEVAAGPVTFSGVGTPATVVEVLSNGKVVASTVVDVVSTWRVDAILPAGTPAISLRTLDADGNIIAESEATTLTVTGAPVPGINLPTTEVVAGPVVMTGTGEPGSTVNVLLDGQVFNTVTIGPDGQWQVPADLTAGDYTLQVQTLDPTGAVVAESNPATITIVGGAAGPTAEATAVADLPATPEATATPEPTATPEAAATSEPTAEPTLEPTVAPTAVPTTAPTIAPTAEPEASPTPEAAATAGAFDPLVGGPVLLGNTTPGNIIQLLVNGRVEATTSPDEAGAWALPVPEEALDALIQVRILDSAGLVVGASQPLPADDIPVMPALTGTGESASLVLSAGNMTWSGTGRPGTGVEVVIDGEVAAMATVDAAGFWTAETVLAPGDYALTLTALDAGGTALAGSTPIDLTVESTEGGIDGPVEGAGTVIDVAESAGTFRTLLAAIEAAGLTDPLAEAEALTVFAPTDEAFNRLPAGALDDPAVLARVLQFHVAPEIINSAALASRGEVETLLTDGGAAARLPVALDGRALRVGGALVAAADVPASNGVIHIIDRVLIPPPAAAAVPTIDDSGVATFVGPSLTVVGTGEPGTTILLTLNDQPFGTTTVGPDGQWFVPGTVGAGRHVLVAYMFEPGGALSGASAPLTLLAR